MLYSRPAFAGTGGAGTTILHFRRDDGCCCPEDIRHPVPGVRYDEIMLDPGDGKVTKPSLLARETLDRSAPQNEDSFIPITCWFFLCERHDRLTGNINFQDNLLNVLLTRSLPWEMNGPPP
jgi:hypothetical protein